MKKGTIYYVLAGIALLVAIIVAVNANGDNTEEEVTPEGDTIAVTTVIQVDDVATEYPQNVSASTSALEALELLETEGEIDVETSQYDFGVLVDSIDGVGTDTSDNRFWIYYINDATASVGAAEYVLQNDDRVLWNYEPAQ